MIRRFFKNLKCAAAIWWGIDPFENSAAITFYSIFSMAPLLLISVSVSGYIFGHENAHAVFLRHIDDFIGPRVAGALNNVLANASWETGNFWGLIVGLAVMLIGATVVIAQLKNSLNKLWSVESDPDWNQILNFFLIRGLALLVVAGLGLGIILLMIASTALSALRDLLPPLLSSTPILISIGNNLLFLLAFAFLWTLVLKLLPDVIIPWKRAWQGALITGFFLWIGKNGIAFYLSLSDVTQIWGAAGASVLLLMWIYYSSLILLFGAAFTRAKMKESAEPWPAKKHAVRKVWEMVRDN